MQTLREEAPAIGLFYGALALLLLPIGFAVGGWIGVAQMTAILGASAILVIALIVGSDFL
jgi:hypothetical protein